MDQKGHTMLARSMRNEGSMAICRLWHSLPTTCATSTGDGVEMADFLPVPGARWQVVMRRAQPHNVKRTLKRGAHMQLPII
jgi:hypothetical protein